MVPAIMHKAEKCLTLKTFRMQPGLIQSAPLGRIRFQRNAPLPFAVSKGVISAVMPMVNTHREVSRCLTLGTS
jgi:hypothetical protein